ncbi:hypothetical protein ONS95_014008 [Cadophora gregata]|uniref:uncharacterized protein n=1 Tax=Cadophora gregata TaxID=51156 RepID=UPI0026DD0C5C|nr:uncharacterized protein ONS95_014008 [Cadophora gregata]KAK0114518.1 hypothetical protein ONS95_014008 [Cadophora gregata]
MLQCRAIQSLIPQLRGQLSLAQNCRAHSSHSGHSDASDLDTARDWFQRFNQSTIPVKIGQTTYSRSSGPGGQKVNKTSSKATTVWPLYALQGHVPKILHQGLRDSNYYVASSDSISIQCDTTRSQIGNKEETYARLHDEITRIYKRRVPGVTSPEQKQKIEHLKKVENTVRLRIKKMHSDKKRSRSSGGNHGD